MTTSFARITLAAGQTLELGTIRIPPPVIPELIARTTTGRVLSYLSGHLLRLTDRSAGFPAVLVRGQDNGGGRPLNEGYYVLVVNDGDGFVGI